ncbi:potassium channel family protein [Fusibacter tunisiensis]|uniref:Trk system potassium uptake protein TrkA n=1 Tax=Fusibacter tunisiensis TaxID=1008308 RepID=A0ABS2MNR7_9FIRM|nr:TrkA family potassium uptake protein [Fusibacter tunisiensis]MBM7561053.1 trk system potassium uptake protein TrkA [Fusibacter tunisiensis]
MKVVIAGGQIIGRYMVAELSHKYDVTVVDTDRKNCEEIVTKYSANAIHGDPKDIRNLKAAGIESADYLVAVADFDSDNLAIALMGRGFNVPNIFVRMNDPEYQTAFELAGATNIASSVSMMVNKFILDIERPEIRRVASFGDGKAEISIIELPKDSIHTGKSIATIGKDIRFPEDCIIAGIYDPENEVLTVPRGHQKIEANNSLFLVGSSASVERAYQFFSQKR